MISNALFNILACPICKGELEPIEAAAFLLCRSCGLKYPVRENIPLLLTDEAISADTRVIGNKEP
ncbi:MAG: Trm112 family protein [Desulfuromonadaceae bacterium]|nr:Trm112 family protein [Desulfuromonadaceae bacterium]